ncbi:aspartate/alanine antiporter [Bacteroidaceae bacterium]|uniref:putative transporter n=1 Tax=Prevotella sp. MGM2 TaxID=2033406 RepID=UPI000CEA27E1|nr:putative transporter [Prevotella sp. MGM2]GAY30140.1 transporter [Prevotella sp. MGM2]GFI34726.1 aspartate/alanine antiporter [Bacteroidaceae bacterium]
MDWLQKIICDPGSIAHLVVIYALVISLGVKLGKIKFGGVALGVTFVLFAGIVVGHIYSHYIVDPATNTFITHSGQKELIDFVKELGLILFVYCIGLQVGPGFFATFKKGGVSMNLIAVGIVALNVTVMLCLYFLIFDQNNYNIAMMVGTMYGAVTNTPGLGAANSVVKDFAGDWGAAGVPDIASSYACAYPLGVVGIILATILLRYICKISLDHEQEKIRQAQERDPHATPKHLVIKVTNQAVVGRTLHELHSFLNRQFVISRCIKNEEIIVPNGETKLEIGMEVHLVCAEDEAEPITALLGERVAKDWTADLDKTKYVSRRLVITKDEINGKTFGQLHFSTIYGVNVTRVTRNGMELFADRNLPLQVGDRLLVTGREENVEQVKNAIGGSVKRLDHPNVGAIFFGILLGVLVGQIDFGAGMKLGLAGGPLVVAILIGAFGYRFKINTYTSTSANLMLREVGLLLFLSSVGIQAGAKFWDTILTGGIHYVWTGFLITIIPILIMGFIAQKFLKLNYFTLMGLIAGSNTDPPALAFANQTAGNDAPAVGYSTVYPLSMFLRIIVAQLVLMIFLS